MSVMSVGHAGVGAGTRFLAAGASGGDRVLAAGGQGPQIWDRVTGTQPAPAAWVVAVTGLAALVVVANPGTWALTRTVITIAHEGGHALVSLLTGRRLEGIRLHSDSSGVTYSRGRSTGPAMVLTAAAGYVTPSLLGIGAAWLLSARHVTAMLWLALVLLIATFLAIRNAYGFVALAATAGAVLAVSWLASALVQAIFGYGAAWFLLLGGVRPVFELRGRRRRTSDADRLASLTRLPSAFWITLFAIITLGLLAVGARLLVPSVPHHLTFK